MSSKFQSIKRCKGKEIQMVEADHSNAIVIHNESKKAFVKIWSDSDEIAVLQGAIKFREEEHILPNADLNRFHSYVSGSLQGDFNRTQIREKLRALKTKYINNAKNNRKSMWKHHDRVLFDLSNIIWNEPVARKTEGIGCDISTTSVRSKVIEFFKLNLGPDLVIKNAHLVSSEMSEDLEKKWLQVAKGELELLISKYDLVNEEARAHIEAMKKSILGDS